MCESNTKTYSPIRLMKNEPQKWAWRIYKSTQPSRVNEASAQCALVVRSRMPRYNLWQYFVLQCAHIPCTKESTEVNDFTGWQHIVAHTLQCGSLICSTLRWMIQHPWVMAVSWIQSLPLLKGKVSIIESLVQREMNINLTKAYKK